MKRKITLFLVLCFVIPMAYASAAVAAKNVTILTGLSEDAAASSVIYSLVYKGIESVLSVENITPAYKYAEIHSMSDDAAKREKGREVATVIMNETPDLVITVGDAALRYIGLQIKDVPVVFTFMFASPKAYGLPKSNITGVARGSYAADNWALANKLFGAKSVVMFSKKVMALEKVSEKLSKSSAVLEKMSGVKYLGPSFHDTFEDWKQGVLSCEADMIYLAYTDRILKDGNVMSFDELDKWTVGNSKVPVIAASEKDVASGALYAIVVSEQEMGRKAAEMALKILKGTPVNDIPIETSSKGKLVVNVKTAQNIKIDIPYEILSTAEKIYE